MLYKKRKEICNQCPHLKILCEFYLRRCSTEKLWNGKLPPPEQCPNKKQLIELGCTEL